MASSLSTIFLLASIMLAFSCHTEAAGSAADVDKAKTEATTAKSLLEGGKASAVKAKSSTCVEVLGDAVDQLNKCLKELKFPLNPLDKSDVQTFGSAALTYVDTCQTDSGTTLPADLVQTLANANKHLSTFLAIVNGL